MGAALTLANLPSCSGWIVGFVRTMRASEGYVNYTATLIPSSTSLPVKDNGNQPPLSAFLNSYSQIGLNINNMQRFSRYFFEQSCLAFFAKSKPPSELLASRIALARQKYLAIIAKDAEFFFQNTISQKRSKGPVLVVSKYTTYILRATPRLKLPGSKNSRLKRTT